MTTQLTSPSGRSTVDLDQLPQDPAANPNQVKANPVTELATNQFGSGYTTASDPYHRQAMELGDYHEQQRAQASVALEAPLEAQASLGSSHQNSLVQYGMRNSEAVLRFQQYFNHIFTEQINIDGDFGRETAIAMNAFKERFGLDPNQELDLNDPKVIAILSQVQNRQSLGSTHVAELTTLYEERRASARGQAALNTGPDKDKGTTPPPAGETQPIHGTPSMDRLDGFRDVLMIRLEHLKTENGGAFTKKEKQALITASQEAIDALAKPEIREILVNDPTQRAAVGKLFEELNGQYQAYQRMQTEKTNSRALWTGIGAGIVAAGTTAGLIAAGAVTAPVWGTALLVGGTAWGIATIATKLAGRGSQYGGGEMALDVALTALPVVGKAVGPVVALAGQELKVAGTAFQAGTQFSRGAVVGSEVLEASMRYPLAADLGGAVRSISHGMGALARGGQATSQAAAGAAPNVIGAFSRGLLLSDAAAGAGRLATVANVAGKGTTVIGAVKILGGHRKDDANQVAVVPTQDQETKQN